jgi:hypothetical protein
MPTPLSDVIRIKLTGVVRSHKVGFGYSKMKNFFPVSMPTNGSEFVSFVLFCSFRSLLADET